MEQLSLLGLNQGTFGITLSPTLVCKKRNLSPSVIAESQAQSNVMISTGKLSSCNRNTQRPKSSKTSAAASTISVKGLKPYWNAQCKEISSKLWLPIKTALQDSDSTLSNGLYRYAVEKSWFSSRLICPQNRKLRSEAKRDHSQQTFSAFFTSQEFRMHGFRNYKSQVRQALSDN
jgi:hypothetical protein